MISLRWVLAVGLTAATLVTTNHVVAAPIVFPDPSGWSVGDAGSTFQEWSAGTTSATSSILDASALQLVTNPVIGVNPTFTQSGAFVASSGGLYSFGADYSFAAAIQNHGTAGAGTWVLIQTAATVNPDYDPEGDLTGGSVYRNSITIRDKDGNLLATSDPSEVSRSFYDPTYPLFGGVGFEKLSWEVFLPGYTDDFRVEATSIVHGSLQALRVDSMIQAVPEPGSIVLLGLGMVGVGLGAYRQRRRPEIVA